MLINKTKPKNWDGKHILLCRHCIGSHCRDYAMYCNVIHTTSTGTVKIKLFGERVKIKNDLYKIRYVPADRVVEYSKYFED